MTVVRAEVLKASDGRHPPIAHAPLPAPLQVPACWEARGPSSQYGGKTVARCPAGQVRVTPASIYFTPLSPVVQACHLGTACNYLNAKATAPDAITAPVINTVRRPH
jgi:hypothetical protein